MDMSELLPQMSCAKCNNYLSREPVMVLPDGRSVCGRCSCQTNAHARNLAYESLAKFMLFPCQYASNGCKKTLPWNTSAVHEAICEFGQTNGQTTASNPVIIEMNEYCNICSRSIHIIARYECLQGHKICSRCITTSLDCKLCKSRIPNEIIYLCKYWTFGCKRKASKDEIKRHETDCDMKDYSCPYLVDDCKWAGCIYTMPKHLKTAHAHEIVECQEVTRTLRMRDDSWVMIAHDEIFKCFTWIGEQDIEWLAKYVGPQERCSLYICEVKLYNQTNKTILKMTNTCHGWNNTALQKCITMKISNIKKYLTNKEINYNFKIMKNVLPILYSNAS